MENYLRENSSDISTSTPITNTSNSTNSNNNLLNNERTKDLNLKKDLIAFLSNLKKLKK